MNLADLLTRAAMISASLDATNLGPLRARLFGRLRASGFQPAGEERGRAPRPADSDAALVAAFARGDEAAFDVLFDRHAPRLHGSASRSLPPADAADVVQEAFLALFQKGEAVLAHDNVNVAGFLFGTLRHKIQDVLAAREIPVDAPRADEPAVDEDALTAVLRREDGERLARLLDATCNPLEQQVVMLTLEDHTGPEIAAALGVREGNVRVLRHRAFAKLRLALEQEAP